MAVSGAPSAVPPNHAARRSPFGSSTMVDACAEGKGAEVKMNSCEVGAALAREIRADTLRINNGIRFCRIVVF
jgi:hypothetical protein